MPPAMYLDGINKQGGGGMVAVPETPITPHVQDYSSPVGHVGAAAVVSPPLNHQIGGNVVSILQYPPSRTPSKMY